MKDSFNGHLFVHHLHQRLEILPCRRITAGYLTQSNLLQRDGGERNLQHNEDGICREGRGVEYGFGSVPDLMDCKRCCACGR